jgi:hypothetical protein
MFHCPIPTIPKGDKKWPKMSRARAVVETENQEESSLEDAEDAKESAKCRLVPPVAEVAV